MTQIDRYHRKHHDMFCPECGHEYHIKTNDVDSAIYPDCRVYLKPIAATERPYAVTCPTCKHVYNFPRPASLRVCIFCFSEIKEPPTAPTAERQYPISQVHSTAKEA